MQQRVAELSIPHSASRVADHITLSIGVASAVPGKLAVRSDGLTGDSYWQGQVLLAWESAP